MDIDRSLESEGARRNFHFLGNKVIVFDIQNNFSERMNEVQGHSEVESLL
jgi:hypothetical protein